MIFEDLLHRGTQRKKEFHGESCKMSTLIKSLCHSVLLRAAPCNSLLLILFLSPVLLFAQQFDFRNYSVGDGLAQSQVYSMMEDSRGYIWMGTRGGGVSRFDGIKFKNYSVRNGLLNNYVASLCEDANGGIWIGTDIGLSRFDGKEFENFNLGAEVRCILAIDSANYLLATQNGILQFDGKNTKPFETDESDFTNAVNCMAFNKDTLWVATNNGLYQILDSRIVKKYTRQDGLKSNLIQSLELDTAGNLWIGTYGGGINLLSKGKFFEIDKKNKLRGKIIFSIEQTEEDIWLGTYDAGVARFNLKDSTFTYMNEKDGLSNNHVRSICSDSWGNIWLGTSGGGVSKFYGQQFVHFGKTQGLPAGAVYSIAEDHNGNIWFGASDEGVVKYDGNQFIHFAADSGFKNVKVKEIYEDKFCNLWLGTEGSGVALYNGENFLFFNNFSGLSGNWIRDIVEDEQMNIYVATAGGGITKMIYNPKEKRGYEFNYYMTANGLPDNRINCLLIDSSQQKLWFGTASRGFGYIQEDSIVSITATDGLVNNSIRTIATTGREIIWLGTASGISRYNPYSDTAKFKSITTTDGLFSNNIYLLQVDKDDNLWAGSESGLDKLVLDENGDVIEVRHYGKSEGFSGIETCQNASLRDSKGSLWFGTISGLTKYNSGSDIKNETPPKTRINTISLAYKPLSETEYGALLNPWGMLKQELVLPYDQNQLSFDFTGINHRSPDKVFYQWKLEGAEEEWSPLSDKSSATYSNLDPGKYTFYLRSCNEDMVCANCPDVIHVTINPPYWATLWFRLSFGGVIVLIIALIFKLRIDQVRAKTERENRRLKMERDMIGLEQKALRLQMNPHFIFNALNSIQSLIVKKDEQTARYFLAKFSKLMRGTLENSRDERVSIDREVKTLESYLALEKFSRGDSFTYEINVSDDIDLEEDSIPPMMIQPFVENAIVHGVAHIEHEGKISVNFEKEGDYLKCTITDNGIGREQANQLKSQQEHNHKSTALAVTQERLDILNAGKDNIKSLEITDLKDGSEKGVGTEVVVRISII